MYRHEKHCDSLKLLMGNQSLPYYSQDCNAFNKHYNGSRPSDIEIVPEKNLNAKILNLYKQLVQPLIGNFTIDDSEDPDETEGIDRNRKYIPNLIVFFAKNRLSNET